MKPLKLFIFDTEKFHVNMIRLLTQPKSMNFLQIKKVFYQNDIKVNQLRLKFRKHGRFFDPGLDRTIL